MNTKGEGITFSVVQSWFIVASFIILVLVVAYNGYSADQRSQRATEERQHMINLSKIIIQDIQKMDPEEEDKLISALEDVFERGIPSIEESIAILVDLVQRYVTVIIILILDIDEDMEEVKHKHDILMEYLNITDPNPVPDLIQTQYNGTHLIINENQTIDVSDIISSDPNTGRATLPPEVLGKVEDK